MINDHVVSLQALRALRTGQDTSFINFSSWVDYQEDNRILVYGLILLIRDKIVVLADLTDIIRGVLKMALKVDILCVFLRSLVE